MINNLSLKLTFFFSFELNSETDLAKIDLA